MSDYKTYSEWLSALMSQPSFKIVPMKHACSEVSSRIVLMFTESPDKPSAFMGQAEFAEIMKYVVR